MRILFLTEYYGVTAPGLVAEKLVSGLSEYANLDVVTSSEGITGTEKVKFTSVHKYSQFTLEKWSWLVSGRNLFSNIWVRKAETGINYTEEYDLVFILVSMWHFSTLELLHKLENKIHCPVFAYFVDAIPSPTPYLTNERLRKIFLETVKKCSDSIDIIYSTCSEMAEFQKETVGNGKILFKELLNPSENFNMQDIGLPKSKTFIYTGKIYPPRNVKYLLEAFARLVDYDPDVTLSFIGADVSEELKSFGPEVASRIFCLEHQRDLSEIFKNCCCFIDLGCDVQNDIFLSSKLPVYLAYNRPIISESSTGAPPRRLFASLDSVYLCGHNQNELLEAMKNILAKDNAYNFGERNAVLEKFSIQNAAQSVISDWKSFSSLSTTARQE